MNTSTSSNLSISELRTITDRITATLTDATAREVTAQSRLRDATRLSVATGDTSARTAAEAEVATARSERASIEATLREAARMLDEAQAAERAEAEAVVRDQLREMTASMAKAADAADEHFARYVGLMSEVRRIEREAFRLSQTGLGRPLAGSYVSEGYSAAARHLTGLRGGSTSPIESFAAHAAAKAAAELATGALL